METEFSYDFNIMIEPEVHNKIMWLTHNYDKEVSAWLGGEIKGKDIIIDDILFPVQEVGSASVDTTGGDLIKLRAEYGDRCKRIIGHWHSHNGMGVFWSSDDEKFIEEHMNGRDLRVFLVSSTTDYIKARVEINKPLKISIDRLNVIVASNTSEIKEEMQKVLNEKVTEKKYVSDVKFNDSYNDKSIYEEIKVVKSTQDVHILGVRDDVYESLEGTFPKVTDVTMRTDGRVDIVLKVGNKSEARKIRNLIKEELDNIQELEDYEYDDTVRDNNYWLNAERDEYRRGVTWI